ncbi:hypothetical protein [Armatimonas sp.]|uniref:hypothetical protein n=1 Tax=Armatimonas sp. TaxID=1872638 RepID=UPI00286D0670|nr:hypothetical protein [Armatimonas sp.]
MEHLFGLRPRKKQHVIAFVLLFVLAFVGIRLEKIAANCEGALPIAVAFEGLSEADTHTVQVVAISPKDILLSLNHKSGASVWELEFLFWAQCVRVYAPQELLQRNLPVTLTIGGTQIFKTNTATMLATWKAAPAPSGLVALDSPPSLSAAHLPFLDKIINGPIEAPFLELFAQAITLACLGVPALYLSLRAVRPRAKLAQWLRLCLSERAPLIQAKTTERGYLSAGLLALTLSLVLLTHGQRYGFVHDDNITQFFPTILQGCRSLEHGIFPTYNPYALMGSPTASMGTYALTYPLTYLSYFVATHLLRDAYLTLDIFAVMHLVLGYLATFALARRIGLRASLAMCVALSFVLCGYFCVYTRGWFYMAPVALWTPLLLLSLTRLVNAVQVGGRWVLETGLVIGLYFHAGNAQMWSYTLLLGAALVGFWYHGGKLSKVRLLWLLPALLVGLAIAAPLLLAQSAEVAQIERSADFKQGVLKGFLALLLPAPLVDVWHPGIQPGVENLWAHLYHFAPLYFCGPVFLTLGLVALTSLLVLRWGRRLVGANAWLLCAGLALWLSLGADGGLAAILAHLPVFNKFQHWWKFLPFVALFSALGGGLIVERWLQSRKKSAKTERALVVLVPLLLAYNAWVSKPVMSLADKPYPALPAELKTLFFNPQERLQRGLTISPWKRDHTGFVFSMAQNFATVYELPMLMGYDPLVEASPLTLQMKHRFLPSPALVKGTSNFRAAIPQNSVEALRRYGVRWICVTDGVQSVDKLLLLEMLSGQVTLRYTRLGLQVYELAGGDPLAFAQSDPSQSIPFTLNATGATITLGSAVSGPVVVNLLARERLNALVDGKPVAITKDAWDRVTVIAPAGTKELTLRYEPAWGKGFVASVILLGLALGLWARLSRRLTTLTHT